jgi:chemotaxis protein methyltransferase CheR
MKDKCLPPEILHQLSALTAKHLGLSFPQQRWRDLEKGLMAAAPELGFHDKAALADHLLSMAVTKEVLDVLANHITINETYFFREKRIFEILEWQILPQLLASRRSGDRRLRIWSAGCASGEEAYSIAMLLHRVLPDKHDWQITILATDISQRALHRAEQGVYGQWSFRGTPSWLVEKYFSRGKGDRLAIQPWIKEMVTFSYLNLAADPFPSPINNTSAMDIIFCRNVLMYFTQAVIIRVVENFSAALVEGGWLAVSPAECSLLQGSCLLACAHHGAITFQKSKQPDRQSGFRATTTGLELRPCQDQSSFRSPFPGAKTNVLFPSQPEFLSSGGGENLKERVFGNNSNNRPASISGSESYQIPCGASGLPFLQGHGDKTVKATGLEEAAGILEGYSLDEAALKKHRSLADENGDPGSTALLAKIYANQGKLEEAITWGEKAISRDRLNPRNYYLLASILQEQSRGDEAITLLKQTLYLEDDFVLAHFSLGNLAMQNQRYREAEKHFDNVLALLEHSPNEGIIPASDGVTSGALREMVRTIKHRLVERKIF